MLVVGGHLSGLVSTSKIHEYVYSQSELYIGDTDIYDMTMYGQDLDHAIFGHT